MKFLFYTIPALPDSSSLTPTLAPAARRLAETYDTA